MFYVGVGVFAFAFIFWVCFAKFRAMELERIELEKRIKELRGRAATLRLTNEACKRTTRELLVARTATPEEQEAANEEYEEES